MHNDSLRILIIGATSAIAEHLARKLAVRGASLFLTGRDPVRLQAIAEDLRVRGASRVDTALLDVADYDGLDHIVPKAADALKGLDTVVFAAGMLPDRDLQSLPGAELGRVMEINAVGAMTALEGAATFFEKQRRGLIVAIGSVAGDRGRAVNYVYGAAKGALEIFLSGLRQRLHAAGVRVLLVKPGFVDTPMTADFDKGPLWASPERVARDIVHAMDSNCTVIYTPFYWRWIMLVIRLIPGPLFLRLRF